MPASSSSPEPFPLILPSAWSVNALSWAIRMSSCSSGVTSSSLWLKAFGPTVTRFLEMATWFFRRDARSSEREKTFVSWVV